MFACALLTACGSAPPATENTRPPPVSTISAEPDKPAKVAPPESPAEAREVALSVINVGDMMLGTDYPENHLPDDDGIAFLADVAPYLSRADLTIGNHEGVLMDGGVPRKQCNNPQACYLFRSPARYARYFLDAGFDVMSLANNHARDFGEEGRSASMQNFAAAGIEHTGREGDFAFLNVNGLSVAVLGYAVTLNSNLVLDYAIAAETVAQISAEYDIVIITFHGGAEGTDTMHVPFAEEEYFGEMRGDVVKFSRMMVDSGADLVVGHGPHVVRGAERYKDRLIAYSLGNFATYYGISVDGVKGVAPILQVELDQQGRFVSGQIYSTIQLRPDGPSIDPAQQALALMRELSLEDFSTPGIRFETDGRLLPVAREHPIAGAAKYSNDAAEP
jgi:hypothetical protein